MIWSISWRNIWRNKVRSAVVIIAVALGLCAGVFLTAFFTGMIDRRVDQAIAGELSHIQIHYPEFRSTTDMSLYIPGADSIAGQIRQIPHVTGASSRIVFHSMISSAETAAGVRITGIRPEQEMKVSKIHSHIIEGDYLGKEGRNPVVIGKKLAENLKVKLRSKVVITVTDMEKNITGGAFRVVGIYETANRMFDESVVFVRHGDLASLIGIPADGGHEIAVLADDNERVEEVQESIRLQAGSLEIMNWKELSPEMNYLTEAMDLYMFIFTGIILLALLFGIINTMLMVVLERFKEIGMLMAIGMNRLRIFKMIILETVLLTLTGGVAGIIAGTAVSTYFEHHPINLSIWAEGYKAIGYDSIVYTSFDLNMLVGVTIMVFCTGIIAAIYPAYKALQYDPAEALRIE